MCCFCDIHPLWEVLETNLENLCHPGGHYCWGTTSLIHLRRTLGPFDGLTFKNRGHWGSRYTYPPGNDHMGPTDFGKFGTSSTQKCRLGGDMWPFPGGYYISIVGAWKGTMCSWGYLKKPSTKNGPQKSWGPRFRSAHLLEVLYLWSSRVLKIRWSAQWTRDGALPDLIDLVKNGVWETSAFSPPFFHGCWKVLIYGGNKWVWMYV